jgi:hypothetical protein
VEVIIVSFHGVALPPPVVIAYTDNLRFPSDKRHEKTGKIGKG